VVCTRSARHCRLSLCVLVSLGRLALATKRRGPSSADDVLTNTTVRAVLQARFAMKKGVPLHTTLMVEATVTGVVSDGLRVNTEGAIKSVDGKTVYCTCKAQLVDFGGVRRITNTNHNMLDHKGSNSSLSSLG